MKIKLIFLSIFLTISTQTQLNAAAAADAANPSESELEAVTREMKEIEKGNLWISHGTRYHELAKKKKMLSSASKQTMLLSAIKSSAGAGAVMTTQLHTSQELDKAIQEQSKAFENFLLKLKSVPCRNIEYLRTGVDVSVQRGGRSDDCKTIFSNLEVTDRNLSDSVVEILSDALKKDFLNYINHHENHRNCFKGCRFGFGGQFSMEALETLDNESLVSIVPFVTNSENELRGNIKNYSHRYPYQFDGRALEILRSREYTIRIR